MRGVARVMLTEPNGVNARSGKELPKTVLCLCGDETVLTVRQLLLEHFGYNVLPTSTVEDAETIAKRSCPDMFLMDGNIPDSDHEQVARVVKELCPDLTVVVMTQSFTARRNLSSAVDCYVSRDDGPRALVHEISRLLGQLDSGERSGSNSASV